MWKKSPILGVLYAVGMVQATPLIDSLVVRDNTIFITPNKKFKDSYLSDNFFAKYRKEDVDLSTLDRSILIMPFLMNVMPVIWLSGQVWEVDELDQDLYRSLECIRKILVYMYPEAVWTGKVVPKKLVKHTVVAPHEEQFAMPFSGGLDSIHTSISFADIHQLLITIREHGGYKDDGQWQYAMAHAQRFADHFGHKNAFVESNYQRILTVSEAGRLFVKVDNWGCTTSHGMGFIGVAAPLLIGQQCTTFKIASSYAWNYPGRKPSCPMIDESLQFAGVNVIHHGFDVSRVDKTEDIVRFFKDKEYTPTLYVCQEGQNGTNCARCLKCLRTINSLVLVGAESINAFGFTISFDEVEKLTRKAVATGALEDIVQRWFFSDMQKWILKLEASNQVLSDYLVWLGHVQLYNKPEVKPFDWYGLEKFVEQLKRSS